MTFAVSLMLTVPLVYGVSTVIIGGNLITFDEDSTGGIVMDEDVDLVINPVMIGGYPAFRFQHKESDPNLVPSGGSGNSVNFEITIPKGTKFIIYVYVNRAALIANPTNVELEIEINGSTYTVFVEGKAGAETNEGYYSAKRADGNNVMQKINMNAVSPDDFMLCEEDDAVLDITGRRAILSTSKVQFAIIYA